MHKYVCISFLFLTCILTLDPKVHIFSQLYDQFIFIRQGVILNYTFSFPIIHISTSEQQRSSSQFKGADYTQIQLKIDLYTSWKFS